jgi:hypothetical protein
MIDAYVNAAILQPVFDTVGCVPVVCAWAGRDEDLISRDVSKPIAS